MSDYVDGDVIFDTQFLALKRAIEGNGILSGLAGSAGPGALQTTWATGTFYANATKKIMGSSTPFTHSAGDITYDRWDLIYGTSAGIFKTEGIASVTPQMPDLPSGAIIIGLVYIPATTVTITAGMIRDFGFTTSLLDHAVRHDIGGADEIPGLASHKTRHQNGGADEISVAGLSGVLADAQIIQVHGPSKHTDRTRRIQLDTFNAISEDSEALIPPRIFINTWFACRSFPNTGLDSGEIIIAGTIPTDAVSILRLVIVTFVTSGTGNCVMATRAGFFKNGQVMGLETRSAIITTVLNLVQVTNHSDWFSEHAGDNSFAIRLYRQGSSGVDTFTGTIYVLGAYLEYTADE